MLPQSTPNNFVITKDGNIIALSSTPIGHYTLNYRICDNSQTSKDKNFKPVCQTATVTIAVLQSVTTPTTSTPTTATNTTSTTVTATTTPTIVTPTVITLLEDTYTLTTTVSTTTTATTVGSVFSNDSMNGKPIDIQKVIFSLLPQSIPNTFIITKDGNIIVPPHTPIGRYTLNYRICDNSQNSRDKNHKPICQTATVTIVVLQSLTPPTTTTSTTVTTTTTPTVVTQTVITLSDDTYTITTTESTTTTATTVGSVFSNDRMNGKPIDIQKVIFSLLPQSTPNNFVITKDGNIIALSSTPIGHYTLNYRICDNSQNTKDKNFKPICQTATVTIAILQSVTTPTIVTPTVITLLDDTYTLTTTESATTTATTVGSIFTNDRLNGKPIDIQKVTFSLSPQSTPFSVTKDGNIIVPTQTPIGRYTLNYRICYNSQTSKDKICQTATITITILQTPVTPTVSATVEIATSSTTQSVTNQPIAEPDSVTTPMNTPISIAVLDNDTPYTTFLKIVVFPMNGDAFVKEDNTILYRPRTRFIGTDYFVYALCTPSSQSYSTATVIVKVTHRVVPDNAMSANGDDKNDYFHIVGIENYPDNQVTIYSHSGEKVFTISHYDNRQRAFKGIVEGEVSLPNAAHLPQDTYFYLIEYYDENRQLQRQIGWLYLKR